MKALTKEHLIEAITENFNNGENITQDDYKLTMIFERLGDDWFIKDGLLQCTKNSDVNWMAT